MRSLKQVAQYQAILDDLAGMLATQPMSAREVAIAMGCGKPTAYRRLRALAERARLKSERVNGSSGPAAVVWRF